MVVSEIPAALELQGDIARGSVIRRKIIYLVAVIMVQDKQSVIMPHTSTAVVLLTFVRSPLDPPTYVIG